MKILQIVGLFITLLALAYYASFAEQLNSAEQQGNINLGFGLIIVYLLAIISAVLIVPSSFILWRKKTRDYFRFDGPLWNSILIANSTLAVAYTAFTFWFAITFLIVLALS